MVLEKHIWKRLGRYWVVLPGAFMASVLFMGGAAIWAPKGIANINQMVFPVVLFPAIWAVMFFVAFLGRRIAFVFLFQISVMLLNAGLISWQFLK